jgi:hypothetical protein
MTSTSLHQDNRRRAPTSAPLESPAQLAIIAIVVWLIGVFFQPLGILAPIGFVLLLVAGAAYFMRPRKRTMYWRGRELDLTDDLGPVERLYYQLFKR